MSGMRDSRITEGAEIMLRAVEMERQRAEAAERELADLRAHHDALHEQRDRALAALRGLCDALREAENALSVGRSFAAETEPDPQHVTVTLRDARTIVRQALAVQEQAKEHADPDPLWSTDGGDR